MRIAITNWSNRMAGGAEQYIAAVAEHLLARGHAVALWHETREPAERSAIPLQANVATWDVSEMGGERALAALRAWRPDIVYCQGMQDQRLHAQTSSIAPAVFFAHNHHGLCISGSRSHKFPHMRPCTEKFGPACLVRYLPQGCGGYSPFTMLREYRLNVDRLAALRDYAMVITHGHGLAAEYERQGIACRRVRYYAGTGGGGAAGPWSPAKSLRLLMLGRLMPTKGGRALIDCLPELAGRLDRAVCLTIAGDGPSRSDWERRALEIAARYPEITVSFPGWVNGERRLEILAETDLLVLPSVWPEPFGMVGSEAALSGVPTAAFRVGGIPEWLTDGVNGTLAPGDPPTKAGLIDAIVRATSDEGVYRSLRDGALRAARESTMELHYQDLMGVFGALVAKQEETVGQEAAS